MSDTPLSSALAKLADIQRRAVEWRDGAVLVLAGPGSGKTQVLTCRIGRLLDESKGKNFRILALTFTNKAADEMISRVANFVPGLEERANIGTFHSFCAQVLRLHGSHIGISPDFVIYSQLDDRKAVLEDALVREGGHDAQFSTQDVRYLGLIDQLKANLVGPDGAAEALSHVSEGPHIAKVFELYEKELRALNALDFNSLILDAHRLITQFPALAARYRTTHPYWLLDEFQDTNSSQYAFIRALAGEKFRNIFAVADDDQIIYQWNGASFKHIQAYQTDFATEVIQLPTNYRCPPVIVDAANKLVAYNHERTETKRPLIAGKTDLKLPEHEHIRLLEFSSDEEEARGISAEIVSLPEDQREGVVVLARTRALLDEMLKALKAIGVAAVVAQRRDDFLSGDLRWLVASLTQLVRPLDRRNLTVLILAYNRATGCKIVVEDVVAASEASGQAYLTTWLAMADECITEAWASAVLPALREAAKEPSKIKSFVELSLSEFDKKASADSDTDLSEDLSAWKEISRDIYRHIGRNAALDQFLQELQLRSKEPSAKTGTVSLMTVHAAKGREFDRVYLVGLAEDVLPSFQSKKKGDKSAEMEEERRNCFVAITRTKEALVLSRAKKYRGWAKAPSRFLVEMGFVETVN